MRFRAAQSRRGVSITLGRANPCGHSRSIQRILRHVPIYSSHSHGLTPATTIQPIFLPRLAMHQIAPEGKFSYAASNFLRFSEEKRLQRSTVQGPGVFHPPYPLPRSGRQGRPNYCCYRKS